MYTVIAPVPGNVATAIAPYREKYDPLVRVISPHISVIDPFQFAGSSEKLHQHLTTVGEESAPIKIFLAGWDVYETEAYQQIHLPMTAGRPELTTLHNNLLTGPLRNLAEVSKGYWPCVVLGRFSKRSDLEIAKKALEGFQPQFVFRVKHLELLRRDEVGQPWNLEKRIGLKATLAGRSRRQRS